MIVDYKILASYSQQELAEEVKDHLRAGWKLQGGVAAGVDTIGESEETFYAQAMIMESLTR